MFHQLLYKFTKATNKYLLKYETSTYIDLGDTMIQSLLQ